MLVEIEFAKSAAYDAVHAAALEDPDFEVSASIAKAYCTDAYFHTAAEALQLHGGIGFTWEHPIHLFFKRAKSSQIFLGSPAYHRDLVGKAIGIPGH